MLIFYIVFTVNIIYYILKCESRWIVFYIVFMYLNGFCYIERYVNLDMIIFRNIRGTQYEMVGFGSCEIIGCYQIGNISTLYELVNFISNCKI